MEGVPGKPALIWTEGRMDRREGRRALGKRWAFLRGDSRQGALWRWERRVGDPREHPGPFGCPKTCPKLVRLSLRVL